MERPDAAERRSTSGFRVEDRSYLNTDGHDLLARLYRPNGVGPFRAVVDVHGGMWIGGDRANDTVIAEHLAANGIAVMSLDFRLPPSAPYPGPVADITAGIQWMARNAQALEIDPSAIFGLGCSSGAHQLMLASMRIGTPTYQLHPPLESVGQASGGVAMRGLITCWGVLAPSARYEMAIANARADILNGHRSYWPDLEAMSDADPQLLLDRGEPVTLPSLLLIQGTEDLNLPSGMPERFGQSYAAAGGDVRIELFEGEAHNFINSQPDTPASRAALDRIVEFVQTR